jgi:hypothetical protein
MVVADREARERLKNDEIDELVRVEEFEFRVASEAGQEERRLPS